MDSIFPTFVFSFISNSTRHVFKDSLSISISRDIILDSSRFLEKSLQFFYCKCVSYVWSPPPYFHLFHYLWLTIQWDALKCFERCWDSLKICQGSVGLFTVRIIEGLLNQKFYLFFILSDSWKCLPVIQDDCWFYQIVGQLFSGFQQLFGIL